MQALAVATVDLARGHGARYVEAYPMQPAVGAEVTWGELHVGELRAFTDAGYRVVHRPSRLRPVVRCEL